MRCLIYASNKETTWLNEYFPDVEPYLLKIANKPLLEYSLDVISLLGINELRIVSDNSLKKIEQHLGNGEQWGIDISYSLSHPGDSLQDVFWKNYSFCKEHDLLIWNGFFFLKYDLQDVKAVFDCSARFCCSNKRILYLPGDQSLQDLSIEDHIESSSFDILELQDIRAYYKVSMSILTTDYQNYVLPGYSNEKGTYLGLNLVYPNSCDLHPPIMIGNHCRFRKATLIGPNSIIGNNVIIDEETRVTESIVYDNTYVGRDLDLDYKIVYKGHLISAISGEHIHITDQVLVSQVETGLVTSYFNRIVQRVLSLVLLAVQIVPWLLLFLPYRLFAGKQSSERLMNKNMKTQSYTDSAALFNTRWGKLLLRLSLDKFDQIWSAALTGKLYLIGNRLLTNTVQHRQLILDLPAYNPGAFSLAESQNLANQEAEAFYELEYIEKISTLFNLSILVKALCRRLIHGF
jgi:lipopolysaccharide/colanic/teichoic acid biosynthesis glycosyltransferase